MAGRKQFTNFNTANPLETIKSVGGHMADGFKDHVVNDLGKASVDDFFSQIFGLETPSVKAKTPAKSGSLKPGEKLDLKGMRNAEKPRNLNIAPGIDYRSDILHSREKVSAREKQEMTRIISDIKVELQRIAAASKLLQKEIAQETTSSTPKAIGKYHVNFFEWLLITLRQARVKIEDGSSWVHAINQKGKKKSGTYWQQFKKQGTSFALSNERNVATQTG